MMLEIGCGFGDLKRRRGDILETGGEVVESEVRRTRTMLKTKEKIIQENTFLTQGEAEEKQEVRGRQVPKTGEAILLSPVLRKGAPEVIFGARKRMGYLSYMTGKTDGTGGREMGR